MMPPRIEGLRTCQSRSAALVTVTKSEPKNTRSTPSTANSLLASGEGVAASADAKSFVPLSMTTRPGRNFRVDGLGVCSVWINKPSSFSNALRQGPLSVAGDGDRGRLRSHSLISDLGTGAEAIKLIIERLCIKVMTNRLIFAVSQSSIG